MPEGDDEAEDALIHRMAKLPKKAILRGAPPRIHLKKIFLAILTATLIIILYYCFKSNSDITETKRYVLPKLRSPVFCSAPLAAKPSGMQSSMLQALKHSKTRSPGKVLLVPKTSYSRAHKAVTEILSAHRISYKYTVAGKNLPDLIKVTKNLGKYGVIFFEDYRSYLDMDPWNRDILDKYCKTYNVGILAFIPTEENPYDNVQFVDRSKKIKDTPVIQTRDKLKALEVSASSRILSMAKSGTCINNDSENGLWVTLESSSMNYEPIAFGQFDNDTRVPTVLLDRGLQDGIPKVLFGSGLARHWLYKLLFLDAIQFLSNGLIVFPLTRYILVDIDDIFVGANRLTPNDVNALIESQDTLAQLVPGFRFNLGFSGKTYKTGSDEENEADELLLQNRHKFWWFPHMWQHQQPHMFSNLSSLEEKMRLNKDFARTMDIPVQFQYSVAPHHSGVYPVHEYLYDAWKNVWGITVTSTEEYPHLRPAYLRRGFVHRNIKVLPRQTCGLFTKNLYYDEYPNGPQVLEKSIQGGELFQSIVNNPVAIFMTHMPNYAFDRLAPYTFESVVKMIKCWTNLDLQTKNPSELGRIYFEMFPEEESAIWGNPCDDKRHKEIWSDMKSCDRLPDFLVIGPQKTGTTALYSFLQSHPSIMSNFPSQTSFEELQFFSNTDNYAQGIDWYMDFFPMRIPVNGSNKTFLFEKSATYFDKDVAPKRASRLLKNAKLVTIIISPSKRAYSWYQHMRAHEDPTALQYSFREVISASPNNASKPLKSLQSRCLEPGKYASHIERWLQFYKSQQLYIVDGEQLIHEPISVMNTLQHFLNVQPIVNYEELLKFDQAKRFYCPVYNGKTKCLGKGKGRNYPTIEADDAKFLQNYYRLYNEHLLKLLKRLGYGIPDWLEKDLNDDDH